MWRSSPRFFVILAVLTLISALIPLQTAYVGKLIIDAIMVALKEPPGPARDAATDLVLRRVLYEVGLVVALSSVERALGLVRTLLGARLGIDINTMIIEKAITLELPNFEDSEFYDKLTRARREASSRPLQLVQETFTLARNALTLAGYAVLIVAYSGWAVIGLLLSAVPAFVAEAKFSGIAFRLRNWRSPESRRLNYLEYVLTNDGHAKEVKLFGLGDLLLGRYRTLSETFYREDGHLATRRAVWGLGLSLIGTLAFYGCYAWIAYQTVRGVLTLGEMMLYVVAFKQGQQAFQSMLTAVGGMYEDNLYMSNLFEYLEHKVPERRADAKKTEERPEAASERAGAQNGVNRPSHGIWFEHVGFRYPNSEKWALRDVTLHIPPGESLALVGENGAGKTTFIKLLTRLYVPTEGSIWLDGKPLSDWDEEKLRTRTAVIFQDFNHYQLSAKENVALGSVQHLGDEPRISEAIENGGAKQLIAELPHGLETALGGWFQEGVELSGGQWQKLAIARAFMRKEADILVLDEPTSALDARAEHAVFQRFKELTKGRTAILISHRFPTVRMADHIIVIEEGHVVEQGSHDALVAKNGKYAGLFELQAAGYK